jgi:hypothetical protein
MMANVEQIMQPSQNELYFCRVAVIVEGIEDVAFITTYLQLLGLWSDFRRLGCHFVVADGKTNLSRPLAIANCLGTPCFVVFDADGKDKKPNDKRDNGCILRLLNDQAPPFPDKVHFGERHVVWPITLKTSVIDEISQTTWDSADAAVRKAYKYEGISQKNTILIAAILEELWRNKVRSAPLTKTCENIIAYATRAAKS